MTTTFGFFPEAALASQAGLPVTDVLRARLAEPSDFRRELRPRPPRYFNTLPALPGPMLLLLDRVSGYWPEGGEQGLGPRARRDRRQPAGLVLQVPLHGRFGAARFAGSGGDDPDAAVLHAGVGHGRGHRPAAL